MTPRERHTAFFQGQPVDRPLVQPLLMTLASKLYGSIYHEYVLDGRTLARAQVHAASLAGLDILSACSDPVRELSDLGGRVLFFENDPPAPDPAGFLLDNRSKVRSLPWETLGQRMEDRLLAIHEMRSLGGGGYPILGWIEGPSSLGAVLRGTTQLMEDFLDEPGFVQDLFDHSTDLAIRFALAQVKAGADMIGMGDAPSSLIGPALYEEYVVPRQQRIVRAVHSVGATFRLHICGNTTRLTSLMDSTGADLIDLDFPVQMERAASEMMRVRGILGNLDPVRQVLQSTPDRISADLRKCHQAAGSRYVVGAGCEIPAATPLENLVAFAAYAKSTATA